MTKQSLRKNYQKCFATEKCRRFELKYLISFQKYNVKGKSEILFYNYQRHSCFKFICLNLKIRLNSISIGSCFQKNDCVLYWEGITPYFE